MNELLPCPFCGGQAELISTDIFEPRFAMSVRCTQCHTGTMYYTYNDTDGLQDAIDVMCELWNTRAERTCRNLDKHHRIMFKCSECGHWECQDFDGEKILPQAWNYCPSCGAKVVEE